MNAVLNTALLSNLISQFYFICLDQIIVIEGHMVYQLGQHAPPHTELVTPRCCSGICLSECD
jgi:hypothetical protein